MDLSANAILITGGASGIGLALAERFLRAGSQVIVCGRREEKLRAWPRGSGPIPASQPNSHQGGSRGD